MDWRRAYMLALAVLGACLAMPLDAAAPPESPTAQAHSISVLPRDSRSSAATILSGAADGEFEALNGPSYLPAFGQRETWLRIQVGTPPASDGLILSIGRLPIEHLSLYPRGRAVDDPVWTEAFFSPRPDAEFFATAYAYRFPRGTLAGAVYYLHAEDNDPSQIRVQVRAQSEFDATDRQFSVLLVFVLTTLGVMALTNLVFCFALRDRVYLHYVAFVVAVWLFIVLAQGLPYRFAALRTLGGWNSHLPAMVGALSGFFATAFCRSFVDSKKIAPRLDKVLLVLTAAFATVAVSSAFAWSPSITVLRQSSNLLLLVLAVAQFLLGSIGWYRGSRAARFFLIAWCGPIIGTGLRALGASGIIPLTPEIVNAFLIGEAAQALILSIGLADRTLELRRQHDRVKAQRELAEAKLRQEQTRSMALEHQASIDALTGVLNRGRIELELNTALNAARTDGAPLTVLFIDVDHFKRVNDNHGHVVGDLCLALVARRICEVLTLDHSCGRYGGEEFLVVLPGMPRAEAEMLAERIRAHVGAEPIPAGGARIQISVSIGAACRSEADGLASALFERVDRALYAAKNAGRNRVAWAEDLPAGS